MGYPRLPGLGLSPTTLAVTRCAPSGQTCTSLGIRTGRWTLASTLHPLRNPHPHPHPKPTPNPNPNPNPTPTPTLTHWEVDVTIGDTRFVQRPLGYPRERRGDRYYEYVDRVGGWVGRYMVGRTVPRAIRKSISLYIVFLSPSISPSLLLQPPISHPDLDPAISRAQAQRVLPRWPPAAEREWAGRGELGV